MAKIKLKTKKGAAKRFKATKNGFKHRRQNRGHNFTAHSQKSKRQLRAHKLINDADVKSIERMLTGS